MSSIDHHYYSSFKQMASPFYDWERLVINMGCNRTDVDINNLTDNTSNDEKKNYSLLVHEYIHFLQNFSTAWGVPVFTDFTLALMKIGSSSSESQEMLHVPLVAAEVTTKFLRDGLLQREDVLKRLNKCDDVQLDQNGTLREIAFNANEDICAVLTNGRVTAELGIKVIREHMAHLGTQLFLGRSEDEIHQEHEKSLGLGRDDNAFSDQSEYWILFEYFYGLVHFKEITRGIFHLMQQCLITLNPEKALLRFMNWFDKHKIDYTGRSVAFAEVTADWQKDSDEVYYMKVGLDKSIEHCTSFLELAGKYQDQNDVFKFACELTAYALDNIKRTTGGNSLFHHSDDLADINYWKTKIAGFGTGIVIYADGPQIYGSQAHCDQMMDSFNFLLSCSLVLKKLFEDTITACPFFNDIPICRAEFKGAENCIRDPFLMLQSDPSGKECLFGNGVKLLGLQHRVLQG